jgi:hypothetical protein
VGSIGRRTVTSCLVRTVSIASCPQCCEPSHADSWLVSLLYALKADFNGTVVETNHFAGDPGSVVPCELHSQYAADGFNQIHPLILYEGDCINANHHGAGAAQACGQEEEGRRQPFACAE